MERLAVRVELLYEAVIFPDVVISTFVEVIRAGKVKARLLSNAMPWGYFRNLSDDLRAIFAYLRTLKPVKHRVDNTEPPTYCKLCRTKHGLGYMN
jgi:hypothetical protein